VLRPQNQRLLRLLKMLNNEIVFAAGELEP